MKKISRYQARKQGLKRYYTGKKCKHGHRSLRFTSNAACLKCFKLYIARWKKEHPNYVREMYWRNPEKFRAWARKTNKTAKRKAYMREYMRKYYKIEENRLKSLERTKQYYRRKQEEENKHRDHR